MDDLLWDVILGRDFLSHHESVSLMFGGPELPLQLGALKPITGRKPKRLFENVAQNCRPAATKR